MRRATDRTPLYRHLALPTLLVLLACREAPPPLDTRVAPAAAATAATEQTGVASLPAGDAPHAPRPIAFDPPLGATEVDPARTALAVTFDRAMDPQGWAWVVESPETAPDIGESHWDAAFRTNTAHVRLQPGRRYVVWINSANFAYFRDPAGVTAVPVRWEFTTAAAGDATLAAATAPPAVAPVRAHAPTAMAAPRVVALEPADGARDVDPAAVAELRVTFDRPMAEGWSWVMEPGRAFPPIAGRAYQTADGVAAALPVRLEPGMSYVVWLNSEQYDGFHDASGTPLPPVRWEFATAPATPAPPAGR